MKFCTQWRSWAGGGALLLLALAGTMSAQERPLPEVARQKSGKAAARVFTNEDLEGARPQQEPLPAKPEQTAPPPAEKGQARITVPGLLEEGTASEARAILESLQRDEQVLQRRYAQIQDKLTRETDAHLRQLYSDSLSRRDETLARKRAQIEQVKKAIALAERGRKPQSRSPYEPSSDVKK